MDERPAASAVLCNRLSKTQRVDTPPILPDELPHNRTVKALEKGWSGSLAHAQSRRWQLKAVEEVDWLVVSYEAGNRAGSPTSNLPTLAYTAQ